VTPTLRPTKLINLGSRANAAHRSKGVVAHCLANSMVEMPSGFQSDTKHALKLAGANALLAGTQEMDGLQPHSQRQMATFKDSSDFYGKLFAADIALVKSYPSAFAPQLANVSSDHAAMRADRSVGPKSRLDIIVSSIFVVEMIFGQDGCYGSFSLWRNHTLRAGRAARPDRNRVLRS
jgi:hypothetical protein